MPTPPMLIADKGEGGVISDIYSGNMDDELSAMLVEGLPTTLQLSLSGWERIPSLLCGEWWNVPSMKQQLISNSHYQRSIVASLKVHSTIPHITRMVSVPNRLGLAEGLSATLRPASLIAHRPCFHCRYQR